MRTRGRPRHPDVLTPAEWRVVDAVRHGLSRREVARRTGMSLDAVRYHLRNVAMKLELPDMAAIRRWEGYPMDLDHSPTVASERRVGGLAQVSLLVRDVDRAVAFYRDRLGLPHLFTAGALAFFDLDGVRLYLHAVEDDAWRPGSVLYLRVDDIAAVYDELGQRGVALAGAPHRVHTHADGTQEWMAFFDDPDGNTLGLLALVPPSGPAAG